MFLERDFYNSRQFFSVKQKRVPAILLIIFQCNERFLFTNFRNVGICPNLIVFFKYCFLPFRLQVSGIFFSTQYLLTNTKQKGKNRKQIAEILFYAQYSFKNTMQNGKKTKNFFKRFCILRGICYTIPPDQFFSLYEIPPSDVNLLKKWELNFFIPYTPSQQF